MGMTAQKYGYTRRERVPQFCLEVLRNNLLFFVTSTASHRGKIIIRKESPKFNSG